MLKNVVKKLLNLWGPVWPNNVSTPKYGPVTNVAQS